MEKVLSVAAVWLFAAQVALSQNWVLTNAGSNNWVCVASSANGSTLIAGQTLGCMEVSTNAGITWTTNALTNGYWVSVASSADGTKLLAAAAYEGGDTLNGVFLSTNSGASWVSNSLPVMYWGSVAMSTDGKIMAAAAPLNSSLYIGGSVFCSTNSGTTWISNSVNYACGLAMSANGQKIFVTGPQQPWYSTNFGGSWIVMTNAPPGYGFVSPSQYIASSADGNKLVLCVEVSDGSPYFVYTSTDSGNTWNLTPAPGNAWNFVTSSADGRILMVTGAGPWEQPSPLSISTNSGASWISNSVPNVNWTGTTCSADGGVMVAAAASDANIDPNSGAIYFSQTIQPPLMSIASIGSQLQLSWLIPSTNFVLEESPDLSSWTEVTNPPVWNLANLEDQLVVPATNSSGFYRLATP